MLIRMLAVAAVIGAGACASDDGPVIEPNPETFDGNTAAPEHADVVGELPAPAPVDRAECQANGPCSAACDPALVLELFVPENTCIVFDCTLDGGPGLVGGCNPSE
jgi:hypothetical protein